jgi:VanZ family protein
MVKYSLFFAILWSVIIIILSSIPGESANKIALFSGADKIGHFGCYLICFYLWANYFIASKSKKESITLAMIIAVSLGIAMEIGQFLLFSGRKFEFLDIIANISGSILGILFFWKLK